MSEPITLPTPDEIAARIRSCREELTALRKLQCMVRAAAAARKARDERATQKAVAHKQ